MFVLIKHGKYIRLSPFPPLLPLSQIDAEAKRLLGIFTPSDEAERRRRLEACAISLERVVAAPPLATVSQRFVADAVAARLSSQTETSYDAWPTPWLAPLDHLVLPRVLDHLQDHFTSARVGNLIANLLLSPLRYLLHSPLRYLEGTECWKRETKEEGAGGAAARAAALVAWAMAAWAAGV